METASSTLTACGNRHGRGGACRRQVKLETTYTLTLTSEVTLVRARTIVVVEDTTAVTEDRLDAGTGRSAALARWALSLIDVKTEWTSKHACEWSADGGWSTARTNWTFVLIEFKTEWTMNRAKDWLAIRSTCCCNQDKEHDNTNGMHCSWLLSKKGTLICFLLKKKAL
jgi:hypothetical protein